MAITAGEQASGGEVRDNDGRLIVVGPAGVAIGGGGGGSDPLSDGTPGGALPSKTLWIAGADGAVLRGITVNSSGHQLVAVQNFPATQPVSGTVTANQGAANTAANGWPAKVTDGTNTAQVLAAAPGSDTGQSALAVRVVSQLGAGSGGGGGTSQADKSAFTEGTGLVSPAGGVVNDTISADPGEDTAAALRLTAKRGLHINLRNVAGTEVGTAGAPVRTDPTGGTVQPVSGTVTANAGTGPFPVSDNAGSLTVDAPVGTPVFVRLSDGTSAIATLPVSLASLPALTAGAAVIGKVDQGTAGASAWKVDGSAVTQPVSLAALPTVTEKQDQPASTTATWTSATGANTAVTVATTGYGTANVSIQVPSTVTAGVITIEVSDDAGTTYYQAGAVRVDNGQQENVVTLAASPGIALNRMYSVSVDAMTQVRARLSTVIVGSGNVLVRVGTVAGGIEPFVAQRSRKVASYRATFRAAATPWYLTQATTANTKHQQLTIHHAASATKTVKLRHLWYSVVGNTVAGIGHVTLYRLTSGTTPATGNPAVTPTPLSTADAAAEVTCLVKPGTAGTEGALVSHNLGNIGVAAPNTATASLMSPMIDLLQINPQPDDEIKPPEIRAGVLEGYGVSIEMSSVTNISLIFIAEFSEESP